MFGSVLVSLRMLLYVDERTMLSQDFEISKTGARDVHNSVLIIDN